MKKKIFFCRLLQIIDFYLFKLNLYPIYIRKCMVYAFKKGAFGHEMTNIHSVCRNEVLDVCVHAQ